MLRTQYKQPNPWKIVAIIFGSILGFICLATIVITILFSLGLGATIMAIWNNLVTPALSYYPPTLVPFQVPTVVAHAPNLNPSYNPPVAYTWGWYDLSLYGFKMEIPSYWTVTQTNYVNDTGPNSLCGLGHDLSEYSLTSTALDEVTIKFLCGPRGGEGSCPSDMVLVDEVRGIYRVSLQDSNEYYYDAITIASDGTRYCGDGWQVGNVKMVAAYRNSADIFDLNTVDHIILSVQEK